MGILVDQAIVTIENIERHMHMGKPLNDAILDGAGEIGVPAFVSTLCICIVFVPMFFLSGVAKFLFVPMAEAVVFAMIASYILSRTLVPTLVMLLMGGSHSADQGQRPSLLKRLYHAFDQQFEHLRRAYTLTLTSLLTLQELLAGVHGLLSAVLPALPLPRPGLLPQRRCRSRSGCTCARRPAHASKIRRASPTPLTQPSAS